MLSQLTKVTKPRNRASISSCERGAIMVLLAVSIVALLGIVGLVVDIGRLEQTKLTLQGAVDSAALACARQFSKEDTTTLVNQIAKKVISDNMVLMGYDDFSPDDITVTFDNNTRPTSVTVQASYNVDSMILGPLGFGGNFNLVSASAVADAVRTYVAVAVDTSGSMCDNQCDPSDPTTCSDTNCPNVKAVKDAVKAVIDTLDENESFALVRFSAGTGDANNFAEKFFPTSPSPMRLMTDAAKSMAKNRVDQLQAEQGTKTNLSDAIRLAKDLIISANPESNATKAMIVMTDGAPWTGNLTAIPGCSFSNGSYSNGYVHSIIEADAARQVGIKVFTVGLGNPIDFSEMTDEATPRPVWVPEDATIVEDATYSLSDKDLPPCEYPDWDDGVFDINAFQGPHGESKFCQAEGHVKNYFLTRVANDRPAWLLNEVAATYPDSWGPKPSPMPTPDDFPCTNTMNSIQADLQGQFHFTSDADALTDIFQLILTDLIRLVQ